MNADNFTMKIPEPVRFVMDKLENAGYSAHCVGGCVRDCLMGKLPSDYDVTTSARPEEMQKVFSDCRVVETGLQHGTITVVRNGMNIEITTYRIDGAYGDNRHPEAVTFTDRLSDDLCRRDFTVNAMAYSEKIGLTDLFGGIDDLNSKTIRCVGRATERFSEDGLRILRALRFSSVLNFTPDKECSEAVVELTPLLKNISRERIHAELTKLLGGVNASAVLKTFADTVAFAIGVTPDAVSLTAERIHEETHGDPLMYYALILSDLPEEKASEVFSSLKPSKEEKRTVMSYIKNMTYITNDLYSVKKMISMSDDSFPEKLAKFKLLSGLITKEEYDNVTILSERIVSSDMCRNLGMLNISGSDLIALGMKGESIGKTLKGLLEMVLRDEIENNRDLLICKAKELN